MLNVRLAGDNLYGENAVHLAVAGDVCGGVFLRYPFSYFFFLFLSIFLNKTTSRMFAHHYDVSDVTKIAKVTF